VSDLLASQSRHRDRHPLVVTHHNTLKERPANLYKHFLFKSDED